MASLKSCSLCVSVLPENSLSNLCKDCTPRSTGVETRKTENLEVVAHDKFAIPKVELEEFDSRDARFTHVAAAGQFLTGKAENSPPEATTSETFPKITNYAIRRKIGHGGGGIVYEARQILTDRLVAIKILSGKLPAERDRFHRETRALGKIKNAAVVEVFEVGDCEMGPYFSMELMEGGSLAQKIKTQGRLSSSESAKLVETVARGMAGVHKAGILHRDLKPGNILLDENGRPKIADFGLAKTWMSESESPTLIELTATNAYLGTPAYMAPEQAECRHHDIDMRTDVYGLGGILYQCLTGRVPFTGSNAVDIARQIATEEPSEPISIEKSIPRDLEAICLKCLEKKSNDRYVGAGEVADDLAAWQRGDPTIAQPASRVQKTVRWFWKKRKQLLTASSVAVIASTINLAAMWFSREDPDGELKKIRKEIRSGKEVTLINAVGKPRWRSFETGPLEYSLSDFGGDVCCYEAREVKFLELLREEDVPPSFIFKAEVRHERGDHEVATTGIYIGRWRNRNGDGTEEMYSIRIAYDDAYHAGNAAPENYAFIAPTLDLYYPNGLGTIHQHNMALKPIISKLMTKWTWRTLTITCQKNQLLEFSLIPDESPFDRPTLDPFDVTDYYSRSHTERHPNFPVPARVYENPVKGGLGLHNSFGKSSFRNVTIQKLPE